MRHKRIRQGAMPSILAEQPEIIDAVIAKMEDGQVLTAIFPALGITSGAFYHYLEMRLNRDQAFAERYARARERQATALAHDVVRIADEDPDSSRARVRVDARRWLAARIDPKVWDDRRGGDVNVTISLDQLVNASLEPPTIEHEPASAAQQSAIPSVVATDE